MTTASLLVMDSIVVQNQSLKETLGEVFEGYAGITASLKKVVFKSPFHPFYYRWQQFTQILERQTQNCEAAAIFSQLLYGVLHAELHETMVEIKDHLNHGVIIYRLLWALFEPGKLVVTTQDGHTRFYLVKSCVYTEENGMVVSVRFIDWDLDQFGYADGILNICPFAGTSEIAEANVFPAEFSSRDRKQRRQPSIGASSSRTSGAFITWPIRDSASYFRANPSERVHLAPLTDDSVMPSINVAEDAHLRSDSSEGWSCGTRIIGGNDYQHRVRKRKLESGEIPLPTEEATEPDLDLTKQELLLCSTHVRGCCLKSKVWAEFMVENNLILSFVEGQVSNKTAFDDLIEGKGLGIIMLLVGNPGTGKTLTAEAVADEVRKPLYILSAVELGNDATAVEDRLTKVLELTEKWDAVLLFDECDVFIQERSKEHLEHNKIVAVFLRLLEYYRGILFMTSNRAETIDRAFYSRIHLTLHYPDLEPAARDQIWRQFSQRSQMENKLADENFRNLAHLPMNGRQIKNVLKIAMLLARQEDTALSMDQIRTVLRATKEIGDGYEV
ncbi:ATPase [Colletotrichum graminicola M1.001]|uniref:ATPase n=1 Tax=Colletotrichum graminicola (strain M1.001 / M2 / FGSC 10212) TaxID=645133 RepID=E3QUG2_COLGM|nr:ATPase [Colletotrichum graminicola M1.001]EFQ34500.1 ATPase [Colletotrichum graminicola M1.001]